MQQRCVVTVHVPGHGAITRVTRTVWVPMVPHTHIRDFYPGFDLIWTKYRCFDLIFPWSTTHDCPGRPHMTVLVDHMTVLVDHMTVRLHVLLTVLFGPPGLVDQAACLAKPGTG